jgi:crossover junction endodeoxyribonuclease RusA
VARGYGLRPGDPDIPETPKVTAVFFPPDKRHRDIDGLLSSMKAAFDGIADAIGVDDSRWQIGYRRGEPVKNGLVLIEIEAA